MTNNPKVSEKRIALTMSSEEVAALDAHIEHIHRTTGGHIPRAEIIRQAIKELIERDTKP